MTLLGILFLIASSFCTAAYSLLFKKTILSVGKLTFSIQYFWNIALHPYFILALIFYVLSLLTWIAVTATEPLSISYPLMIGLCLVLASIGSYVFLNEVFSVQKFIGLSLIILGVIVLLGRTSS